MQRLVNYFYNECKEIVPYVSRQASPFLVKCSEHLQSIFDIAKRSFNYLIASLERLITFSEKKPRIIIDMPNKTQLQSPKLPITIEVKSNTLQKLEIDSPPLSKEFAKRMNVFSAKMYHHFAEAKGRENFFFFVPNLTAILSMIYAGAPKQLKEFFEREWDIDENTFTEEQWHQGVQDLNRSLEDRSEIKMSSQSNLLSYFSEAPQGILYQASHAIAVKNSVQLSENASKNLGIYNPEVISFDNAQDAETKSNQWIKKNTGFKDLVKDLEQETLTILITTLIFGGKWMYPFKACETQKKFYNANGEVIFVDTMYKGSNNLRNGVFAIPSLKEGFEILELPFHGRITMIIAKPIVDLGKRKGDLTDYYKGMMDVLMSGENPDKLIKYITNDPTTKDKNSENYQRSNFSPVKALRIYVPKFSAEEELDLFEFNQWELTQKIKEANFNGSLVETTDPREIKAKKIVLRTSFKMHEKGVEVKAAAYSPTGRQSCDPSCFINSPFVYFFYDQETETILGGGRMLNLQGKETKSMERW